jgi:hypothetical protein
VKDNGNLLWVLLIVGLLMFGGGKGCALSPSLPLAGMRVLILDETAPKTPLPSPQQAAIRSLDVRAYLDTKTLADSKGGKGWRKEDPDVSFAALPQEWQDIRAKVKPTEYPWVAIADDKGGIAFEGPYPKTGVDEALTLFKKYGGGP